MKYLIFILAFFSFIYSKEIRLIPPNNYTIKNKYIIINMKTKNFVDKELLNTINSDVTTTFSYYIILYKEKLLFDEEVKSIIIHKRINYDIWSEVYSVTLDYPNKRTIYSKNLKYILNLLTKITHLKVINIKKIEKKSNYYFKTRLTIKITQLNSYMHIVYNLLSVFMYKSSYIKSKNYTFLK